MCSTTCLNVYQNIIYIYINNLCTYICVYFKIKVVLKLYSANEKVSNAIILPANSMDLGRQICLNLPADTLRVHRVLLDTVDSSCEMITCTFQQGGKRKPSTLRTKSTSAGYVCNPIVMTNYNSHDIPKTT